MLGDFLTKLLTLLFGYAFPAFECFRIVEQRPGHIEQLRFWCQYWIIVAIVMIVETVGVFVQWIPAYGELKLAFLVYLWYPKTKGTDAVYDTFLRPYVMQYEPDIEQRLNYLRANAGKLIVFYIKNFADKGVTVFLESLNYVVSQTSNATKKGGFFSFRKKKKEEEPPSVSELLQTALNAAREKNEAEGRQRRPHQNRYDDRYNYRYDD
ncbi:putative HVA22-like protein g [Carex littledalei]|uniref:HVA22-like protein n=1 Tax=Carex littledalei TaxID=544730 RepID=A0A833RA38_9POAL|nr:putative HVA22-like protein g [Carex littledalei]